MGRCRSFRTSTAPLPKKTASNAEYWRGSTSICGCHQSQTLRWSSKSWHFFKQLVLAATSAHIQWDSDNPSMNVFGYCCKTSQCNQWLRSSHLSGYQRSGQILTRSSTYRKSSPLLHYPNNSLSCSYWTEDHTAWAISGNHRCSIGFHDLKGIWRRGRVLSAKSPWAARQLQVSVSYSYQWPSSRHGGKKDPKQLPGKATPPWSRCR